VCGLLTEKFYIWVSLDYFHNKLDIAAEQTKLDIAAEQTS